MAASSQQFEPGTSFRPRSRRLEERVVSQYLACLAVTGRPDTLENFVKQFENTPNGFGGHYHLAVALALQQRTDEALGHLRRLIAAKPEDTNARKLAYRLLVHRAQSQARAQDWTGLSEVITEALTLAPPDANPACELGSFKNVMPVAHMRAGNRKEASALWEQQLQEDPMDSRLIHNLALLHYWWARGAAQETGRPLLKQWQPAIAYWVLLVNLQSFWTSWSEARKKAWGTEFSASDLESFREGILEEHMEHFFQAKSDECAQKKDAGAMVAYQECTTTCLLEKKSAACWRRALELLPADKSRPAMLNLPAGVHFFQRFGLLPQVENAAGILARTKGGAECTANLQIYFSGSGLGAAAVLSEERNRPDEALLVLDKLPARVRNCVAARYVRALALVRLGANLNGKKQFGRALTEWKSSYDLILEEDKRAGKDSAFTGLFGSLKDSLCAQIVEAAQMEASRLKQDNKLDEAIAVLESARAMDKNGALLEYLCIYLCDRAFLNLNKEAWQPARESFSRVLKLKPGFQRAVQGLSTTYNNEGCNLTSSDPAIALFEKALEINPENYAAKKNLARELKSKAVGLFNALNPHTVQSGIARPVQMLERAVKLVGSDLKPDALATLERLAGVDPKLVENSIDELEDDVLKSILHDLAVVYNIRRRVRGY
jgi:tetratricopeptide (TPR) repeat protein